MAKLLVLYKTPVDPAAFDKYYFETHVPIAKKIPGLLKYTVNNGPVMTRQGPAPIHLVAELHFADLAALQAGSATPEAQAAGADVANFATGGVDVLIVDTREI